MERIELGIAFGEIESRVLLFASCQCVLSSLFNSAALKAAASDAG